MNQPHESKPSNPATITASEIIHNEPAYNIFGEGGLDLKALARDLGRPVRILGIGGTTSEKSWSLVPLQAALDRSREAGAETELASVYQLDLPMFRTDWRLEDYPPKLAWLIDEVRKADGLILCSPTYHGTISGALKNVLDALIFLAWDTPPYLGGKPVAVMAYGGMTSMGVLHALTTCVRGLKGITVPTHVSVPERAIDRDTVTIVDERISDRIDHMVGELLSFAARLRIPHRVAEPPKPTSTHRNHLL
ncbi:MAG: NAD(P)H-dependent oxidoreductase [Thermomicrobiales bacterium]